MQSPMNFLDGLSGRTHTLNRQRPQPHKPAQLSGIMLPLRDLPAHSNAHVPPSHGSVKELLTERNIC
jgi:hypothetical protein